MDQYPEQQVVVATGLSKQFTLGDTVVHALRGVDINVANEEFVAILGASGSGKSTLLGLLGGLDTPTAGRVQISGIDITNMNENRLAQIRNRRIGFVFQFFNLITTLTALENVELPIQFSTADNRHSSRQRATELLTLVGLADRLKHRPSQLSGGEQQRVAIARALANSPDLILADEPTGNLDTATGEAVMGAFLDARQEMGSTLVLVTHDARLASQADRTLTMQDGAFVL